MNIKWRVSGLKTVFKEILFKTVFKEMAVKLKGYTWGFAIKVCVHAM